ncbi:isochorismatase family protein [Microtetraspora fusca]|uniref:Isochorismatase family protein n=1 Tax=Microtetraspora fusca TaxID=1997 RepID=A0ABW6VBV5_MICFU|nr:isochorismatase family protein [Microtetraspora fusca]
MRLGPLDERRFQGLHHVCLTVADLDRSIAFYGAFGFREIMRWSETPEVCADGLGIPGAAIELAHLRGHGIVLELMVYSAPPAAKVAPSPADVGTAHLALVVDDIDAVHAAVTAAGATVVSDPVRDPSADSFQIVDPDGIRVEFIAPDPGGALPPTAVTPEGVRDEELDSFSAHRVESDGTLPPLDGASTALLVVDMLNDFCSDGGAMVLPGADRLHDPINRLVDATRQAGGHVVWVCDRHDSLDDEEFRKRAPHCLAGTWGAEVVDGLSKADDDHLLVKRRFSAFFQTDLDAWLRRKGITRLIVCGVVTNICVRSTAHDGFFLGYDVLVPRDACAATGSREQASTLYDIETHFGTVAGTDELCLALEAAAKGSVA